MSFVLIVLMEKYDPTESSYQIMFVNMLQILNLRYYKYFFIIKYINLELIFFYINLDITSSSKVLITFDHVLLSIVLLIKNLLI